jgi:ABC-type phosphate/phosphonate transport system substrate-binding protein
MSFIASLGMYDGGELTSANDTLWGAVAERLAEWGLDGVPRRLERQIVPPDVWLEESLLFGQVCGFPYASRLSDSLRLIGTPDYDVPGCARGHHRSFVVVNRRSEARGLRDLRGAVAVINDPESMTGRQLLGEAVAEVGATAGFFDEVLTSGSHAASLTLVATDESACAAIDCVSFAHLALARPEVVAEIRVLARTGAAPSLPFVVATAAGEVTAALVARALREAVDDPRTKDARRVLHLTGIRSIRPHAYQRSLLVAARADAVFGKSGGVTGEHPRVEMGARISGLG